MDLINTLLTEAVEIAVLNKGTALSAAKYPVSGSFIPVGGVHRFAIIGVVNAVDSAITLQVQQAVTIDGTPKNITDAVKVIPATTENGKWFSIEVDVAEMDSNNGYKYVTVDVSGPAGANDLVTLLYVEIGGAKIPVTQGATFSEAVNLVG